MWLEDEDPNDDPVVSDEFVDVVFKMECRTIPVDHAENLFLSINEILDLQQNPVAIHQIHVAESSNGWNRPQEQDAILMPSKRTRLIIRSSKNQVDHVQQLSGSNIDISGHELTIGHSSIRKLSNLTTLFARYVETSESEGDDEFIQRNFKLLKSRGYTFKKMMSGRLVSHLIGNGVVVTRKLMIAGFSVQDAIRLQQEGIGEKQNYGFGIFMPHKGIDPVNSG